MLCVILVAFAACCSNVYFLEVLIREDPGCSTLISFSQFLFIACEGFIFTSKFGTVMPVVPIREYILLVVMFFIVSVTNNLSLSFGIAMPLHMIFKSGSLISSMLMSMVVFKRSYKPKKYVSVLMITIGIFITTWASQTLKVTEDDGVNEEESFTFTYFIGVFLLSFSLLLSSVLGIYQEYLYKTYGKQAREVLFYSHALPLPLFMLLAQNISSHLPVLVSSPSIEVPVLGSIPKNCLILLGNVFTQYLCVKSVFKISSTSSSLTTTLFLTIRKFVSLLFSVFYFKNSFTRTHWLGTILVFGGTAIFTDLISFQKKSKRKRK